MQAEALARPGPEGGRIEPAEPEPPPAHSLGRVDEDVMGRSGQLVRPRSLDAGGVAGGVAGGEELVARLVVRLVFSLFFRHFPLVGRFHRFLVIFRAQDDQK